MVKLLPVIHCNFTVSNWKINTVPNFDWIYNILLFKCKIPCFTGVVSPALCCIFTLSTLWIYRNLMQYTCKMIYFRPNIYNILAVIIQSIKYLVICVGPVCIYPSFKWVFHHENPPYQLTMRQQELISTVSCPHSLSGHKLLIIPALSNPQLETVNYFK